MKEKTLIEKLSKVFIIAFLLIDVAAVFYETYNEDLTDYLMGYLIPIILVTITMFIFIVHLNENNSSRWFVLPLSFMIIKTLISIFSSFYSYKIIDSLLLICYIFILIDAIRNFKNANLSKLVVSIVILFYVIILIINEFSNHNFSTIEYILMPLGISTFSPYGLIGYLPFLLYTFFGYKKIELKADNHDVVRKMKMLKELLDNGLITTEDFNLKKEELLKLFK